MGRTSSSSPRLRGAPRLWLRSLDSGPRDRWGQKVRCSHSGRPTAVPWRSSRGRVEADRHRQRFGDNVVAPRVRVPLGGSLESRRRDPVRGQSGWADIAHARRRRSRQRPRRGWRRRRNGDTGFRISCLTAGTSYSSSTAPRTRAASMWASSIRSRAGGCSAATAPPSYAASGYLFFTRDGTLHAQGFDAERLELKGDPVAIVASLPGQRRAVGVRPRVRSSIARGPPDERTAPVPVDRSVREGAAEARLRGRRRAWARVVSRRPPPRDLSLQSRQYGHLDLRAPAEGVGPGYVRPGRRHLSAVVAR